MTIWRDERTRENNKITLLTCRKTTLTHTVDGSEIRYSTSNGAEFPVSCMALPEHNNTSTFIATQKSL